MLIQISKSNLKKEHKVNVLMLFLELCVGWLVTPWNLCKVFDGAVNPTSLLSQDNIFFFFFFVVVEDP